MRTILVVLTLLMTLLLTLPGMSGELTTDLSALKREIKILKRVIGVVLEEDEMAEIWGKDRRVHLSDVDSLYLAGQGLVLKVSLSAMPMGEGRFFRGEDERLTARFGNTLDWGEGNRFPARVHAVFNEAMSNFRETYFMDSPLYTDPEAIKQLGNLSKTHAVAKEDFLSKRETLLAQLAKTEDDKDRGKALLAEAKVLAGKADEAGKAYQQGLEQVRREGKRRWQVKMKPVEQALIQTLCEYGVLRALPDGEHVTLVFEEGDRSGKEPRDKVFVFKKADLQACRAGQLSVSDLEAGAVSYGY